MSEGTIAGKVTDRSFGLILLSAIGQVSSLAKSAPNASVYDHTFTMKNDNTHPSLTIEVKDDVDQKKYSNGMIESLKILAEVGQYVNFSAEVKAKAGASANNTPSYLTTEHDFISSEASVKIADTQAELDGATASAVRSIEISIEKNLEYDPKLGSLAPNDINNRQFSVEGNIEALFDSATFRDLFANGTGKAVRLEITGADTIGDSSNPKLVIDIHKCTFQDWSRPQGNDDTVTQSLKFKGHYSLTDSKIVTVVLTNLVASY